MRRCALILVLLCGCHKQARPTAGPPTVDAGPAARPVVGCDLSTDEAVARQYHLATGKELATGSDRCLLRSRNFPGLVYLGGFASDLGCEWFGELYGCKYGNGEQLQPEVLAAAGWSHGDGAARQALIMKWLGDGALEAPLDSEPEHFAQGKRPFTKPIASSSPDGGVKVVYWTQAPAGMVNEVTFRHNEYAIGASAAVSTATVTESFSVPLATP